jgi:hypothetical protein
MSNHIEPTAKPSSIQNADLEANHEEYRDEDKVERYESRGYQSTVLPASAADLDPEPHRQFFRKFANPAPLGLSAFGLTTFVFSLVLIEARGVTVPNIAVGLGTPS